jgi:hypothetical protein
MTRARAALLLATALVGCRQVLGLDEREVGPTRLTAENYVATVARAFCDEIGPCCAKYGYGFKVDACERLVAGSAQGPVANARRLGIAYDAAAADECLRTTIAYARLCEPTAAQAYEREVACNRVYRGVKAPGERCEDEIECAFGPGESPTCSDDIADQPSFCQTRRQGVEGDPCSNEPRAESVECARDDGLRCDFALGRCVRLLDVGAPCVGRDDCVDGAYCRLGACVAKSGPGAECAPEFEPCDPSGCAVGPCGPGLYCDVVSRSCLATRPPGAACETFVECGEGDCNDGRCEVESALASSELCGAPRL